MTGKSGGSLNTIADNATILSSSSSRYKTIQNDEIKIKYLGLISRNRVSLIPFWAIIRCPDNLKIFFAGIPQGPLETSPGTIKKIQKRFQGPPARGF